MIDNGKFFEDFTCYLTSSVHPLQSTKLLTTMNFNRAFYKKAFLINRKRYNSVKIRIIPFHILPIL